MGSISRRSAAFVLLILSSIGVPIKSAAWEQQGVASWYGGIFQGRLTANGEIYDTYGYTCAHRTLPFGTVLEVTNLANDRSVRVRVNDRGPFVDDRIIDLTYAAARDLDMIRDGTAEVRLVAVDGGIPEVRFTVRVGAWSDLENAVIHRRRLEDADLEPTAVLGSDGITRIFFEDVEEAEVYGLTQTLNTLGYTELHVNQTTSRH